MSSLDIYPTITTIIKNMGASLNVTHYTLTLGDQNATTGLYPKNYSAGTTIEMPIFSKSAQQNLTAIGIYLKAEHTGFTQTAITEGDEIKDDADNYYRVDYVKANYVGDQLIYYEAGLSHLPLHEV